MVFPNKTKNFLSKCGLFQNINTEHVFSAQKQFKISHLLKLEETNRLFANSKYYSFLCLILILDKTNNYYSYA